MAKDSRSARQKQYRSLEKLRDAGLYGGRIDKRKHVTKYQKSILQKFIDVIKDAARVLFPKNPKRYKDVFTVKRGAVVVPRAPGETITVTKSGDIKRTRRGPRGEEITGRLIELPPAAPPPPPPSPKRTQFAVPFARGKGVVTWKRFPSWEAMNEFMGEYETDGRYPDWLDWAWEEEISDFSEEERNAVLMNAAREAGKIKDPDDFARVGRRVRARRKRNKSGRAWKNRRERE